MVARWIPDNTVVFNSTAPVVPTVLDLSAIVGAQITWVMLVVRPGSGSPTVSFRTKDDADDWLTASGCQGVYINASDGHRPTAIVQTDETGCIEWISSTASGVILTVAGYVEDVTLASLGLIDGSIAASWSTLDAGASIDDVSVVLLKDAQNVAMGSSNCHILRARGETGDWVLTSSYGHTANRAYGLEINKAAGLMSITDAAGLIDLYSSAITNADIDLVSYVKLGNGLHLPTEGTEVVFPWGASPLTETELDLSPAIGVRQALVFLKVRSNGSGANTTAAFREAGSARDINRGWGASAIQDTQNCTGLVVVSTDADGKVEWRASRTSAVPYHEVTVLGWIPTDVFAVLGVTPSYLGLRVWFSGGVNNDSALNNPDNYNIIVSTPTTAFDFGVVSVTPEPDVTNPTYVDLEMTDCTNGADYQLVVTSGVITRGTGEIEALVAPNNTADFVGVSDAPIVLAVIPMSLVQVKVVFSKYMAQLSDLFDPLKYVWSGGVRTLKVDPDTTSSVILTVTTMVASQIYDLTVG